MHNGITGKAMLLSIAWAIAGVQLAGWPWWRALLTAFVACLLTVLVVTVGSGLIDDKHWPRTVSERLRSSGSFLTWSGLLLVCAWWMGSGPSFVLATALLVLLWMLWIWPAREAPTVKGTLPFPVPPEVEERAKALPRELPAEIEKHIDSALEDWQHLRELLASHAQLDAQVDLLELRHKANATLTTLLDAATHAAQLARIASQRLDDEHAPAAAEEAQLRVRELSQGLHDTTSSLLRYLASQHRDQESALRVHVEALEAMADVEEALSPPTREARR